MYLFVVLTTILILLIRYYHTLTRQMLQSIYTSYSTIKIKGSLASTTRKLLKSCMLQHIENSF